MKFELKDFQEEAARKLVDDMTYLMDGYERRNKIGSCCLAAPTGAGKTVIAAAVIEGLIEGNDAWGVKPDADACVLWVTDLPSLADQTRLRLIEATDLDLSRIESITATFCANHTSTFCIDSCLARARSSRAVASRCRSGSCSRTPSQAVLISTSSSTRHTAG